MKSCVCGVSGAGSPTDPPGPYDGRESNAGHCVVSTSIFRRLIILRRHMPAEVRLASVFAFAVCALSFGGEPIVPCN